MTEFEMTENDTTPQKIPCSGFMPDTDVDTRALEQAYNKIYNWCTQNQYKISAHVYITLLSAMTAIRQAVDDTAYFYNGKSN